MKAEMIRAYRLRVLSGPTLAIGLVFLTPSLLLGSWAARLPEVQTLLALSKGQLGWSMLGLSFGSLSMTVLSGWLLGRLVIGRATVTAVLLQCLVIATLAWAGDRWMLMALLFAVGFSSGFLNVAMNAAVAAIEKQNGIPIMSTCHGMFSLGGMAGAATSGVIAEMGVPLPVHLGGLALLMTMIHLSLRPELLSLEDTSARRPQFSLSRLGAVIGNRDLLLFAFISFCFVMSEGAISDWSAVYLRNELGSSAAVAGLGYAGFALFMAAGRFFGDTMQSVWTARRIIIGGGTLGAAGLLLAVALPYPQLAIAGFTLVGLGFSIIVPITFSVAARSSDAAPSATIATVAAFGAIGLMVGRFTIGPISDQWGLSAGLAFVAGVALLGVLAAASRKF